MSYLVIARKWRPKLFSEIVGQEHVTRTLLNAVSSGRIAHAYLFSGPRGVGKTTAARILAKSVNCKAPVEADPCNECENCKGITNGSSIDCIEIDGASNTGVDSVRELRDSIKFVPASSTYKVYIIDEVHMLSTAAFNALLKTLEEPPPHAIFIFATTEIHKIPRTILSRCQRFDFKRIPFKEIAAHLRLIIDSESIKATDEVLGLIAREADGSLRDAQSLLDQTIAYAGTDIKSEDVFSALGLMDRTILFDLASFMLKKDGRGCLNLVEKVYNFGYDLKSVSLEVLELVRDLTIVKVTGDTALLEMPESETEVLVGLSTGVGLARLQMIFQILTKGYEEISRSETQRFSLEMTLLRAAHSDEMRPVGELIEELKALKVGLPAAPSKPVEKKVVQGGVDEVSAPRSSGESRVKPEIEEREVGEESFVESKKEEPPQKKSPNKEDLVSEGPDLERPNNEEGDFSGLLIAIKEKDRQLHDFLVGASLRLDGSTLIVTLDKPKGFMNVKEDVLKEVSKEYYKRSINIEVREGAPEASERSEGSDTLVEEALEIFGGRVVEAAK